MVFKVIIIFICGLDFYMYCGYMFGMKSGDVVGYEFMGIIDEVGLGVKNFKKGRNLIF